MLYIYFQRMEMMQYHLVHCSIARKERHKTLKQKPFSPMCYAQSLSLVLPMDSGPSGSSIHGDSPGKNTGKGCRSLILGIFPTQGSNPSLPHCRWILYQLIHKGSPRILNWVAYIPSPVDLLDPGIELGSSSLQVDSLPAEPQGKPKNTGVGSLSLLQGIFPTQELNRHLLHCRPRAMQLYQLSYQGSP